MAVVPQPATYYIVVFGNNYANFHYIPTEDEYNSGVRPQLAFDHDILKAERLAKDDMLDVVEEFGGTVYECSETYTNVTDNLPARSVVASPTDTSSANSTTSSATDTGSVNSATTSSSNEAQGTRIA